MFNNLIKAGTSSHIVNFPHKDDKKRWKRQLKEESKDWKYRSLSKNPIYFTTNSMGYRTHEFDFDNDTEYMLTLGCSNTYGLYLHEEERYSNLIEQQTGIKTYNLGICGGSANIVMMNLSKLLYSGVKLPKVVIIQWPEYMRINLPYTEPDSGIYSIRASTEYSIKSKIFEEFVRQGNIIETQSFWAKDLTYNILNSLNIKIIDFAKDKIDSELYNVSYIEKIDKAYDNKHIGTETNASICNFILEGLDSV